MFNEMRVALGPLSESDLKMFFCARELRFVLCANERGAASLEVVAQIENHEFVKELRCENIQNAVMWLLQHGKAVYPKQKC